MEFEGLFADLIRRALEDNSDPLSNNYLDPRLRDDMKYILDKYNQLKGVRNESDGLEQIEY